MSCGSLRRSCSNLTHCLVEATSPAAAGPFTVNPNNIFCDQDFVSNGESMSNGLNVGLFDPSVFVDPTSGTVLLTWSRQWAPNGGSEIVGMDLNSDGSMPAVRAPTSLITFNAMIQALQQGKYYPYLGTRAYVENPQYIYNSTTPTLGKYTFSASLGSYGQARAYHSIGAEFQYLVPIDSFLVKGAGSNPPPNPQHLDNPGGLSALTDTDVGNLLMFAAPIIGGVSPRYPWWEGVNASSGSAMSKAFGSQTRSPNLTHPILPPDRAPYRAPYRVPANVPYTPAGATVAMPEPPRLSFRSRSKSRHPLSSMQHGRRPIGGPLGGNHSPC